MDNTAIEWAKRFIGDLANAHDFKNKSASGDMSEWPIKFQIREFPKSYQPVQQTPNGVANHPNAPLSAVPGAFSEEKVTSGNDEQSPYENVTDSPRLYKKQISDEQVSSITKISDDELCAINAEVTVA